MTISTEDRIAGTSGRAKGIHRLLVSPDAFNISVLFQPTLAFLERMHSVLPEELTGEDERGFDAFLDDFILHTYLPQLEDKVTVVFMSAAGGADAFQEDPSSRRTSPVPIVKVRWPRWMRQINADGASRASLMSYYWSTAFARC